MGNWLTFLASGEERVPVSESSGGCGGAEKNWLASATGTAGGRERACKWCGRFSARVKDIVEGPLRGICQLRLALDSSAANQLQTAIYEPQQMVGVMEIGRGWSVVEQAPVPQRFAPRHLGQPETRLGIT